MKLLFLGTGTSTGVPMIGCGCETCTSSDVKDVRLRSSALFRWSEGIEERSVLLDTSTDLRQQALANAITRIDSVLYTHPHADHLHGIDELRSFNFIQNELIPCYGSEYTLGRIRVMFDYIFNDSQAGGGKPKLKLNPVASSFTLFGKEIVPLPVKHGEMDVFGYRIGELAYATDCNDIPDSTFDMMKGVRVLVLGALQMQAHTTHFTVDQALEIAKRIGAEKTYLTHLNHRIKHDPTSNELPAGVFLAWDGLELTV